MALVQKLESDTMAAWVEIWEKYTCTFSMWRADLQCIQESWLKGVEHSAGVKECRQAYIWSLTITALSPENIRSYSVPNCDNSSLGFCCGF